MTSENSTHLGIAVIFGALLGYYFGAQVLFLVVPYHFFGVWLGWQLRGDIGRIQKAEGKPWPIDEIDGPPATCSGGACRR